MKIISIILSIVLFYLLGCNKASEPTPFTPTRPGQTGVIIDNINNHTYAIYSNAVYDVLVAYQSIKEDGEPVLLSESQNGFPTIFDDNLGNSWDVFGKAISGPDKGEHLKLADFQVGYWFSLSSMFEEVTLYDQAVQSLKESQTFGDWLIDPSEVRQGAVKDAIPAIDNPEFDLFKSSELSEDLYGPNELIIATENNQGIKLYPHAILNWHEVINDQAISEQITISYCPLTGTSSIWNRTTSDYEVLSFGVSGLLYNSNLILYDRNSESLWSQILETAVHGDHKAYKPRKIRSLEINWQGAQLLGDEIHLLSQNTGFVRNYENYPYGDYQTSSQVFFPLTFKDQRLHPKERVLAILSEDLVKVYRSNDF